MRIITGTARGIQLKAPESLTRPTTDRVREALFSILGDLVENANVLDLFAGSGALGLEALSRGAARATLVEKDRKAVSVIRYNIEKTKLSAAQAVEGDVIKFIAAQQRFAAGYDLIFADPPYVKNPGDFDFTAAMLEAGVAKLLKSDGILVIEAQAGAGEGENYAAYGLELLLRRSYGKNALCLYKLAQEQAG